MTAPTLLGQKPTRHGFGEGLVVLGERHDNVIVLGGGHYRICDDVALQRQIPRTVLLHRYRRAERHHDCSRSCTLGKIPFFASYGAFCALRNADQLRISVAYNEANVKIGGGHAGISVGPDGATHQVLEEVAFLRTLPHMTMIVPADFEEAKKATIAMGEHVGPAYIASVGHPSLCSLRPTRRLPLVKPIS